MTVDLAPTQWISSRYQLLERIGSGGMGVVFRALDRLTGQRVALKQVTTPSEKLEFGSSGTSMDYRLALAQEFKTLASLRHPNIISVLDYGFDAERQPYYTMELLEGAQSIIEASRDLSNDERVELLMQAFQALAYLHRRNIIHRDLKPDNVVVIGGEIKVLDFGLAVARKFVPEQAGVIGTLAYMAPEVLRSAPATEASDLYSMGVIAYEIFAGEHPFGVSDIAKLIGGTLNEIPDFSALDVDEGVLSVIMRLLIKNPIDRYASARDVINEFAITTGRTLLLEPDTIRESYLQAATFVGREKELGQLTNALYNIIPPRGLDTADAPPPQGSIWLVEGESGVGKSRLMEELRSQALVAGALVLRGQAIEDGGLSYQIWRTALRYLTLQTELSDVEAGVLKLLVPDIDMLIGRPVAPAPEVDPVAAQQRLLSVIESVFLRQTQPILLLLEDLHWADEGLQVIKLLSENISHYALMIVGSYRSDEAPSLADDFLEADLITLERLSEEEIASLSESMLGPVGRQPDVVQFLERETEGNVFFIVEVVRALAEEAGHLEEIGRMTLPESVFARGMRAIIQHRLNRLPESALLLLQVAAVGGRELDLNVLQVVPTDMEFGDWLFVCEMESVLEIVDNSWRFVHDKLREQLLDDLSYEARAALHQYYATALEEVYPDDAEITMTLAHHWEQAGSSEKVAYYTALAGEQAMGISAYDRAVQFLNRALNLVESKEQEAKLERLLAEAHYGLGNTDASLHHTNRALRLMDMAGTPNDNWRSNVRLGQQLVRQAAHRFIPFAFRGRNADESDELLTASVLHIQAAQSYVMQGDNRNAFLSALYALNLAEKAAPSSELAYSYAAMAMTSEVLANPGITRHYLKRAQETLAEIGEAHSQVQAMAWHASATAQIGLGDFDQAGENATRARAIFEEIGDIRRWNEASANIAFINACQGRFQESLFNRFDLLEMAQRHRMSRGAAWALAGMIQLSIRMGRLEETQTYLTERTALIRAEDPDTHTMTTSTYAALYHLRRSEWNDAKIQVRAAARELETLHSQQAHDFYAHFNTLEVLTLLRELEDSELLQSLVLDVLARAERFTNSFPFARSRYQTWQALNAWMKGQHEQAIKGWQRAIETAAALTMPYDEALARYQLGSHLPPGDPQRNEHLQRAFALFEQCDAAWDMEHTMKALNSAIG